MKASTACALAVADLYSLVYAVAGSPLIDVLTGIEEVRAAAVEHLPWLVLAPVVSVWSFQLDGIFIGSVGVGWRAR